MNNFSKNPNTFIYRAIVLIGILLSFPVLSNPVQYTFVQSGYSEGATVFGSFTGNDLNNDGRLTKSFTNLPDEITDIQFGFSGKSEIPAFSIPIGGNLHLPAISWFLNGGALGDNENELEVFQVLGPIGIPPIQGTPNLFGYRLVTGPGSQFSSCIPGSDCAVIKFCDDFSSTVICNLSRNQQNATIQLSSQPIIIKAVPIPATAWLFISAIAGLFGIKRWKSH